MKKFLSTLFVFSSILLIQTALAGKNDFSHTSLTNSPDCPEGPEVVRQSGDPFFEEDGDCRMAINRTLFPDGLDWNEFNRYIDSSSASSFRANAVPGNRFGSNPNWQDERDFFTAKKEHCADLDCERVFDHTITDIAQDDDIALHIYINNNARINEGYTAKNVSLTLDWNNPKEVKATINAGEIGYDNQGEGLWDRPNPIYDIVSLRFVEDDAQIQLALNQITQPNTHNEAGKTATWNLGDIESKSPGGINQIIVNFDVVAPKLEIIKTSDVDDGATVLVGDTITYTVQVENTGTMDLNDVILSDQIGAGQEYVNNSATNGATYDPDTNTVELLVPSLTIGDTASFSFQVTVTEIPEPANEVCNQAHGFDNNNEDPTITSSSEKICYDVEERPIELDLLEINKRAVTPSAGSIIKAGDTITYEITVTNPNDTDIPNVTLEDFLPDGVDLVNYTPVSCDESLPFIICDINPLRANETFTLRITVKVKDNIEAFFNGDLPDKLCNGSTVWFNEDLFPDASNNFLQSDQVCHPLQIETQAPLVNKTAEDENGQKLEDGDNIKPGDTITYIITVENPNEFQDLQDVTIEDVIPNELSIQSVTPNTNCNINGQTVSCTFATITAGSTVTIRVTTVVRDNAQAGEICNTADYQNNSNTLINPINNTGTNSTSPSSIFQNISRFLGINSFLDQIFNPGNIEDITAPNNNQNFTEDISPITATEGNNIICLEIQEEGEPELEITKTAEDENGATIQEGDEISAGQTISYVLTVENTGAEDERNVIVEDILPNEVEFKSVTPTPECLFDGRQITCTFDVIPAGDTVEIRIITTVQNNAQEGEFCNTSIVTMQGRQAPIDSDENCLRVGEGEEAEITKAANPTEGTEVESGNTITYTIRYENPNEFNVEFVSFTDELPNGLDFENVNTRVIDSNGDEVPKVDNEGNPDLTPYCVGDEGTDIVTCSFRFIPRQGFVEIIITATVNNDAEDEVCNIAEFSTFFPSPIGPIIENTNEVCHPLSGSPDGGPFPSFAKSSDPEEEDENGEPIMLQVGQEIEYTIRLDNTTDNPIEDVTITDQLPEFLEIDESSFLEIESPPGKPFSCTLDQPTRTINCQFEDENEVLDPDEEVVIIITGTISTNADPNEQICNEADLLYVGELVSTTNEVCHNILDPEVFPSVSKVTDPETEDNEGNPILVSEGDTITYQIIIDNTTNAPLEDIIITDALQDGLEFDGFTDRPENDNCEYNNNTNTITCTFPEPLPNNPTGNDPDSQLIIEFTATVTADAADQVCNQADVEFDGNRLIRSNTSCHEVDAEDTITVTKTANPSDAEALQPGAQVIYTINFNNPTNQDVQTIEFTDELPEGILFQSVEATNLDADGNVIPPANPPVCSEDNNSITCDIDSIVAGGSLDIVITAVVEDDILDREINEVCNTARFLALTPPLDITTNQGNELCHNINEGGGNENLITKSSEPEAGSQISAGSDVFFTITINNITDEILSEQEVDSVFIEDIIPEGFTFVSVDNDTECVGLDTDDPADEEIDVVQCTFDNLIPGQEETIIIHVTVDEDATGEICNTALIRYVNGQGEIVEETSNAVCLDGGGGNGTGGSGSGNSSGRTSSGSAPSHPTIGTCVQNWKGNQGDTGDRWQCVARYPKPPTALYEDPYYDAYVRCSSGGGSDTDISLRAKCLVEWAYLNGYEICGPAQPGYTSGTEGWFSFEDYLSANPGIIVPYVGSQDADQIFRNSQSTGQEVVNYQCGDLSVNIPCDSLGAQSYPPSISSQSDIIKTIDKDTIARGETVTYDIEANLKLDIPNPSNRTNFQFEILDGIIKIYDYTVPNASGNIWYRKGIENSTVWSGGSNWNNQSWNIDGGWSAALKAPSGGVVFERPLTSSEENLLENGVPQNFNISYEMDSELAIDSDVAQLQNVAFAVVEIGYIYSYDVIDPVDGTITTIRSSLNEYTYSFGTPNADICTATDIKSLSTKGALSTVNVVRPFLESKGGGNIGFDFQNSAEKNLFGSTKNITDTLGDVIADKTQTSGQVFQTQIDSRFDNAKKGNFDIIGDFTSRDKAQKDAFFFNLKNNLDRTQGYQPPPARNAWNFVNSNSFYTTFDNSGIYFLENGNAEISGTLNMDGQSKTFIIENGDLLINQNFEVENGFIAFIVRNGDLIIKDNVNQIQGLFLVEEGAIKSESDTPIFDTQLIVSGALIGDATDLIGDRRYIGNPSLLEPSIKIISDLRLIEKTPPALEQFLGKNWRQEVR